MEVLKMEYRGEEIETMTLNRWLSHGKEWAARVVGLDPKYGLALEFCPVVERDWSRSGKNGTTTVRLLGPGFYKISNPTVGRYGRETIRYYKYETNAKELVEISENEVYKFFKQQFEE